MSARVLRGGSWNNNQDNARSEYRNNNQPQNRNNNSGFRVVVSSHIQPRLFNVERVARTMVRAMGRRDVGWRGCVLSARSKAASRRLHERFDAWREGRISFGEFDASVQGWINHVRYADSWGLRRHVLEQLSWP